jgi:CheY-like chemotaxis protein
MTTHILMVDDEPDAQDLFRQNFRREIRKGLYDFDFALSGEAALEALRKGEAGAISLVLSDINMPGMSGIDLLAEVREAWPEMPVMMITAYGDAATEARARALGAERLLTKPVDFGDLKQQLSAIVEGRT